LLGLDGSGRSSVVSRVPRRRRPYFGAEVEFVQRDASLLLPFDDLAGITVTAARMLQMQGFISADGILQQFFIREEAAFFGQQLGYRQHAAV
jgi:hypothetical protein